MFDRSVLLSIFAATFAFTADAAENRKPIQVFILAGQSNMEGKAKVSLLEYQIAQPENRRMFGHLQKNGEWVQREDVWIKFLERHGNLTVGYGSPKCIGPELEFGNVVGDHFDEPVLLIKTAWGGKSLWRDFRPPSAGLPAEVHLEKMLAEQRKKKPETTLEEIRKPFGASYRDMIEEVNSTLGQLKTLFPSYAGQGHTVAGFIWFQGWNDMISADYTAEYTTNLAHFIRDVRHDFHDPKLPFVVGQMGVDGTNAGQNIVRFKAAQAAILTYPEFKGNVALVKTDIFWDTEAAAVFEKGWQKNLEAWNKVGSDYPYHYLGSAKTLSLIGRALASAVLELRGEKQSPK